MLGLTNRTFPRDGIVLAIALIRGFAHLMHRRQFWVDITKWTLTS
jgi:K+-transporting ATPase A subunit